MADDLCCKLVGAFPGLDRCLISISSRINTEVSKVGDNLIIGPTIGVVNISAYINNNMHVGCIGRIGVSIPWLRKYDCDTDTIHFLFQGEGQSNITGNIQELATLNMDAVSYRTINASASSGPASLYEDDIQYDGYGLDYKGAPWAFDTGDSNTLIIDTGLNNFTSLHLQNFSAQFQPGQLPTASYDFIYANSFSSESSNMQFVEYY